MSRRNSNYAAMGRDLAADKNLSRMESAIDRKEARAKYRFARSKYTKAFSATVKAECQLYLGEKPFPRFAEYTTFERSIENKKLESKFVATIKNGETKRHLSSWRWTDAKAFSIARKEFIEDKILALRERNGDKDDGTYGSVVKSLFLS